MVSAVARERRRPPRRPRRLAFDGSASGGSLTCGSASTSDEVGWPSFRAPIDTGTGKALSVNGRARLHLAPGARQTVVVPLESLYWDHYDSVIWPSRPLRRVVLPGRYDLTLEIHDPDADSRWRSDPIPAVVKKAGSLHLVKPD